MQKKFFYFALLLMTVIAFPSMAMALPNYLSGPVQSPATTCFELAYPAAKVSAIDSCTLCHTSVPALNPYGSDFASHSHSFTAIESLDSDGDGYTNIVEINAHTFPGDPASHPVAQVSVPNVVGLTQAAAGTALTTAGLVVGTVTTQSSTTVPSGSVISQNPASGASVAPGSAVNLVVSTGAASVSVPNVVGKTQAAAGTALTTAGLVVGTVTTQSSATVPSGSVISQNPASGASVASGSAVNLVVSSGPPSVTRVIVPGMVGQTQAAATSALTAAGLVVGTVTTQSSATVPSGSVISQNPASGASVAPGSAVNLVVSSGAPSVTPVSVPNVVGLTQTAATSVLTTVGLKVGTVTAQSSATVPSGSVISQNPASGASVASASSVNLVVSSGSTSNPLYHDNFSLCNSSGCPNWETITGSWSGKSGAFYSSAQTNGMTLVMNIPSLDQFSTGRLESKIGLSGTVGSNTLRELLNPVRAFPNASIIFGYVDSGHYRYVTIQSNHVFIGQVGDYEGETQGTKAVGKVSFRINQWHRLRVDIHPTGVVSAFVDPKGGTADRVAASFSFGTAVPGRVGYSANKARSRYSDFYAWDAGVLPPDGIPGETDD